MWLRFILDVFPARSSRTLARQRGYGSKAGQRPRSFSPRLEALEDRSLPSTFAVTNLLDTGAGSLRDAISAANTSPGADEIDFAVTGTIALTGTLAITDSVAINGPGVNGLTVSGSNVSRVFLLNYGNPTVDITGLTIANGSTSDVGGGIYEDGGTLTLDHCALSGNQASAGGGIYVAAGTLTLDYSTLFDNVARGVDGSPVPNIAPNGGSAAGGGLYVAGGTVSVNQCTVSSNSAAGGAGSPSDSCSGYLAGDGGQGDGGGIDVAGGAVSIDNSTFASNRAAGGNGGADSYCPDAPDPADSGYPGGNGGQAAGGAILVSAGTVSVQHSTFSGNRATGGAAVVYGYGPPGADGVGSGGGFSNVSGLQMYDTILAGNTADFAPDFDGTLTSLGHNLVGNSAGGSGFAASDLLNADPKLGPLQYNGGPTQTMALLAGSPALDAGDNTSAPAYDQRGPSFPRIVGGGIDIGAFEVQNGSSTQVSSLAVTGFPTVTTAGVPGSFTVTATNIIGTTDTSYTGTVVFTSSDPQAALPAAYTFTAADAGVHTFSATLKTAGTQSITATDSTLAGVTGSATGITVTPAAASTLTVAGFPSPTTAGAFGSFTVTLRDAFGNIASGYTGTVHFTSSDAQAALPANYTFTAADAGVRTLSALLKTAGTQSITSTDNTTASLTGTEGGIVVTPAAASQFLITAPASVSAGSSFSLTLTVEDAYGNVVTGYTGTVHFSSTDSRARLPANYTFTAADKGVHTFTGLVLRKKGYQTITITDTHNSALKGSATVDVI